MLNVSASVNVYIYNCDTPKNTCMMCKIINFKIHGISEQIQMKTQKSEIICDETLTLAPSTIKNAAQDPYA
jgi:hypothetical protein